ncbi:carbohydrate kinase family protein [Lentibacillus cibarius]|nr:carbohydrate kinase [Lentibacillus cibarius]
MKQGAIMLGEALVDFIPANSTNTTFQRSPGGAPANVAAGLARLGEKATFLGKVGDDVLGKFMKDTLASFGVRTNQLSFTRAYRTGLTFVTNTADGDRSFDFYIDPSADRFLASSDIDETDLLRHKILHIGSISLIQEPARQATRHAVKRAKENGMLISYDPNLRMMLWESEEQARTAIVSILQEVDILKLSEEELTFITESNSFAEGVKQLAVYNIPYIVITLGAKGSYVIAAGKSAYVPAMNVTAVDTTGAGDAFVSAMLYCLCQFEKSLDKLTLEDAKQMAEFAAISGALTASTKGAMQALPTLAEVKQYL